MQTNFRRHYENKFIHKICIKNLLQTRYSMEIQDDIIDAMVSSALSMEKLSPITTLCQDRELEGGTHIHRQKEDQEKVSRVLEKKISVYKW